MAEILFDTYGKTNVRLTYVDRNFEQHEVRELNVNIFFEGEFNATYTNGDNSGILPTDTMKNTVYVLAKQLHWNDIETFARGLAEHFLARTPQLRQVRIEISETPWARIGSHTTAFIQGGAERRVTELVASRSSWLITSGLSNLQILKTAHSAFTGFTKDEFTTLAETNDRLFGTVVDAKWTYTRADIDFNALHKNIRGVLLNTFAEHHSLSVQHTLFAMADAALNAFDVMGEVWIREFKPNLCPD